MSSDSYFILECVKRLVPDTAWYGDSKLDNKSNESIELINCMLEIIFKELTSGCLVPCSYEHNKAQDDNAKRKQKVIKWAMEYLSDFSLDYDIVDRFAETGRSEGE